MSIALECPNPACARAMLVSDELAGRRRLCPFCKTTIDVPGKVVPRPSSWRFKTGTSPACDTDPLADTGTGAPIRHGASLPVEKSPGGHEGLYA
jgi:hypothetical protein